MTRIPSSEFFWVGNRTVRWLVFLVSLMIVIFETPYLTRNLHPALIVLPVVFFFFLFFHSGMGRRFFPWKVFLSVGIFVFLEISYKILEISTADWGYHFATYKFFFLFLSMACIAPFLTRGAQKFLCVVSILGLTLNMLDNIRIWLQMGPAQYVVFFLKEGQRTNTADTPFSTAVMLLMGAAFVCFRHGRTSTIKLLALTHVVFCGYVLIFVLQRSITFFLGISMLMFLAFPYEAFAHQRSLKMVILLSLLLFTTWFTLAGGLETSLAWLADLLAGERIQERIDTVLRMLQSGEIEQAGGSLTGRYHLAMLSVHTFLQSPSSILFGVGDHRLAITDPNLLIGNHSQLFDMFARYGVIGGGCFVWILVQIGKTITRISRIPPTHPLHMQLRVVFAFFLVRTLLGTTLIGSVATQLFVTVPLVVAWLAASRYGDGAMENPHEEQ